MNVIETVGCFSVSYLVGEKNNSNHETKWSYTGVVIAFTAQGGL